MEEHMLISPVTDYMAKHPLSWVANNDVNTFIPSMSQFKENKCLT